MRFADTPSHTCISEDLDPVIVRACNFFLRVRSELVSYDSYLSNKPNA